MSDEVEVDKKPVRVVWAATPRIFEELIAEAVEDGYGLHTDSFCVTRLGIYTVLMSRAPKVVYEMRGIP